MGHWFQATFALLSIDIDTQKKISQKNAQNLNNKYYLQCKFDETPTRHITSGSLIPFSFFTVSNWRILQHASQVLSKSAPNVYYGQNASMAAAVHLAACPHAPRLSPSQVAPRSLPLAVFPSLVAPRSSPLAVFPSPLNVPPGIPYFNNVLNST